MSNAIRKGFHSEISNLLTSDIRYKRANYYYFLGKIEPWGNPDLAPTDYEIDSDQENNVVRSNSLFMKKISPNDISEVVTRYDWISGTVFAQWDNTLDMSGLNFYCLTVDNTVYKCLDNGNGSPSTVKPTGNSYGVTKTSDGYLWKYMYTIPAFKRSRFSSFIYMPVQRALSNTFYNKGGVNEVIINSSGINYSDAQLTTITVTGTTTGSGATGTITVGAGGAITGANITNGGSGYTSGVNLSITSALGIQGSISAVIVSGVVTGITIISAGVSYGSGDSIVFTVGGAVLIPMVSRINGSITSVKIVNAGIGYVSPPTLTVVGTGGTGEYGNSTAIITCVMYQGKIVIVNLTDPGLNYPFDNSTTILVQGTGTGAQFTPVVFGGSVIGVIVENPGTGYTSISLAVLGTGTGANLSPVFQFSDFVSDQSIIEQTTIPGAIYSIKPVINGNNYTASTVVTIDGDGTGCTVLPVIVSGSIVKFNITSYGSGYSYANVVITDANRNSSGSIDATAYSILPPRNGHGRNALTELLSNKVVINSSLRKEKFLETIVQDYRQFGIIKNPRDFVTGTLLTGDSYLAAYKVQFDTTVGLVQDQLLNLGNVKFRVVFIDTGNVVYLQQSGMSKDIPVGTFSTIPIGGGTSLTYVSSTVISSPLIDKYSGALLYVSNETPFYLAENQGIVIKTFLTF
jgi:hypothetical protein